MAKTLSNPSELGGGGFLKPRNHMTSLALLIEPVSIERNVPNTYKGKTTERDVVTADVTVFENQRDLTSGTPTVLKGVAIDKPGLTRPLEKIMGGAMIGVPELKSGPNGEYFAWRDVTDRSVLESVTNYFNEREAAVSAAVDDAPDFD